jgi:HAMP domain-containing protein
VTNPSSSIIIDMNDTFEPIQSSGLAQWILGAIVAIPAAIVGAAKVSRSWSADRVARVADDAQAGIYEGMVKELERLRKANSELAGELDKAQLVVTRMAGELRRMTDEVGDLQSQLARLIQSNT